MRSAFFAWSTVREKLPDSNIQGRSWRDSSTVKNLKSSPNLFTPSKKRKTRIQASQGGIQNHPEDLPVIDDCKENSLEILRSAGFAPGEPFATIAPGARWESKKWPARFFGEVVKKVMASDKNAKFAVLALNRIRAMPVP